MFEPFLYQFIDIYKPLLVWLALQPFLALTMEHSTPPSDAVLNLSKLTTFNSFTLVTVHFAPKARSTTSAKSAFTLSQVQQEQLPEIMKRWSVNKARAAQLIAAAVKSQSKGGSHTCVGLVVRLTEDCEAFLPVPLVDNMFREEPKIMEARASVAPSKELAQRVVESHKGMDYPFEPLMK